MGHFTIHNIEWATKK